MRILLSAIAASTLSLLVVGTADAQVCKGSSGDECVASEHCQWVKGYVRKSSGKIVSAYCRNKAGWQAEVVEEAPDVVDPAVEVPEEADPLPAEELTEEISEEAEAPMCPVGCKPDLDAIEEETESVEPEVTSPPADEPEGMGEEPAPEPEPEVIDDLTTPAPAPEDWFE